jgi:purine-nucleoside phosphorylase
VSTVAETGDQARVAELAEALRAHGVEGCELAIVLGSGLGVLVERVQDARAIAYEELAAMPRSGVPGHAGKLVVGRLGGLRTVLQQGRVHLYEGFSAAEVTRAVRAFAALGIGKLVLTNAAGSLRLDSPPGTLMRIEDHLDLQGRVRLPRAASAAGTPWDPRLGAALDAAARQAGQTLPRGVYAALFGPSYETPAEIRMLRTIGADAVGMSTVAEACAARAAGMRVCGVSCLTNYAAGTTSDIPNHEEVVEEGRKASKRFCDLLETAAPLLVAG